MNKMKLGDILKIKHGYAFKGENFSDKGEFILLTPANFYESGGFKYTPGKEKYYLGDFPQEYLCKKGDLIVAMTQQAEGLLGSTAIVPEDNIYLHNQRIGVITVDETKADKKFVDYLFRTKNVRFQIEGSSSGTKVKHTSPDKIYDVDVWLPDLDNQRKIGEILSTIDENIRKNNNINQELEELAQTIYNYWFVQFEFPNEEGKPYKSSGGQMKWSIDLNKELPEGWEICYIKDLVNIKSGYSFSSNDYDKEGLYKLVTIKNVQDGFIDGKVDNNIAVISEKVPDYCKLKPNDILISLTGNVGRVGLVSEENMLLNQRVGILDVVNERYKGYIYSLFRNSQMKNNLEKISGGTSQKNLSPIITGNLLTILPPKDVLDKYNQITQNFIDIITKNNQQNNQLFELREFLLPILMNGQVNINE